LENGKTGRFLVDTGSMSSIISNRLINPEDKVKSTRIKIAVANNENLPINGITRTEFKLRDNPDIKLESAFIVAKHKWDNFDGLIGNDILIQLGAKVDMKNRLLECEKGNVQMKVN